VNNLSTLNIKQGTSLKDLGYNKILTPQKIFATVSGQLSPATINNEQDSLTYPQRKIINPQRFEGYLNTLGFLKSFNLNDFLGSAPSMRISANCLETITTNKQNLLHSTDQTILSSDQTIRQYSNLNLTKVLPGGNTLTSVEIDSTPYSVYNNLLRKNINLDKSSS